MTRNGHIARRSKRRHVGVRRQRKVEDDEHRVFSLSVHDVLEVFETVEVLVDRALSVFLVLEVAGVVGRSVQRARSGDDVA